MENKDIIFNSIYKKYGYNAMLEKWIEELLELTTLLQQSKSKTIDHTDLVKEVSDVSIILEQIVTIHDIKNEVIKQRSLIIDNLPDKLGLA
jgi:NTP pyrophosphatase (non-canonical NTP hydrolase)